VSK
jgi:RNA recognition motif-containing protein